MYADIRESLFCAAFIDQTFDVAVTNCEAFKFQSNYCNFQ